MKKNQNTKENPKVAVPVVASAPLTLEQVEAQEHAARAARQAYLDAEAAKQKEMTEKLGRLHESVGLADTATLIAALKRISRPASTGNRTRIPDNVRERVKEMVSAGQSGTDIAKELGISVPSVQNIKKAFGLIRPRAVTAA